MALTNEFRQVPLSGDWVLISPGRAAKPGARERLSFPASNCPFDDPQATHQETPIAIYAHGTQINTPEGWTVQVLPNKYPVVSPGQCGPVMATELFSFAAGVGSHELVITRDHDRHFANFSVDEMTEVVRVYLDRYRALSADTCNKYISIFHNHGVLAGASIFHNHSQIISMPIVPPQVQRMVNLSAAYLQKTGRRLASDLLSKETARVVCQNEQFVAFCPFASRAPYEINISRKNPQADFRSIADTDVPALAGLMQEVFARLDKALDNPDYTFFLHSAPADSPVGLDWCIEIMPRFSPAAGLEFATGVFVNTTDPDQAAETLRAVTL